MRRTSCVISFGLYDVSAKQDARYEMEDRQPFVDLEWFNPVERVIPDKIATLEADGFLLDESFILFPDDASVLKQEIWSRSMSDAYGVFEVSPRSVILFSENHSSSGLTLHFYEPTGDYPSLIRLRWYDASGYVLSERQFEPDGYEYYARHKVENYRRIEIEIMKTRRPFLFFKMVGIDFGSEVIFDGENIVSARMLEEVDPITALVSINTLNFTIHSDDAEFSLLNPKGSYSLLQQRQALNVTEIVGDREIPMGTFYLNEWQSETDNKTSMKALAPLGLADKILFAGGMYVDIPASELVSEMEEASGLEIELSEVYKGVPLSGHIPISTIRESSQQIAFALGAVVDCSRDNKTSIFPPPHRPSSYIGRDRKFLGGTVKMHDIITGVNVTAHRYIPNDKQSKLLEDELMPGQYEITFTDPIHSLEITGGDIAESNANRAVIIVREEGPVLLTGYGYTDNKRVVSKRLSPMPANITANERNVTDATLINGSNAGTVADRIFSYYQNRFENTVRILADSEKCSDMVIIDSTRREKLRGAIESMNIDLAGGFIAEIKVVGERIEVFDGNYTGEFFIGEELGVL